MNVILVIYQYADGIMHSQKNVENLMEFRFKTLSECMSFIEAAENCTYKGIENYDFVISFGV